LAPLPFHVTLADGRRAELALADGSDVSLLETDALAGLAESAPDNAAHVVMTHSHALDSLIAGAVLERGRFRYLGIIGSKTKRASFRRAFRGMGLPEEAIRRVFCPIGGGRVRDKRPEVIAALAAAEIAEALLSG
jgi:xanthine dehydrogenase accessory factor